MVVDRYELAWAAGFFDGEGWADLARQEGRRTGQPMARVNQADPDGVPEVLVRFQRALGGIGTIGGPRVEEGRIDLYRWHVSSRGDVELLRISDSEETTEDGFDCHDVPAASSTPNPRQRGRPMEPKAPTASSSRPLT